MALLDPHSFADADQPSTRRLTLKLAIDFIAKTLSGTTTLELDRPATGLLDLDTRSLRIDLVTDAEGRALPFTLGELDPIKGQRLRIETTADRITIQYCTGPGATALQWLDAEKTAGKKAPFVYTQCQAIHARSVMPCQDTPRVRATYLAELDVPDGLVAVMAASAKGSRVGAAGRALYDFEMPQPIPSYLFALAVGDLVKRDLGPRSAVYAEPPTLEAAAHEFAEVDRILTTAEGLFGAYPWERFDLLVMPPSFPYGGMENPRLTFLTPSLLAGDRSLVNVVGHELAHSWTGNLVTNASMNDFWLNEGFTVYAERRILRALEGEAAEALHASLGRSGLDRDIARLTKIDPKLTRLRARLEGVDPDDVYSLVPYEKGCLFLIALDRAVGRERFDRFLAEYIRRFQFQSITTETFLAFLEEALPEAKTKIDVGEWIDGVGIPKDAPAQPSARLVHLEGLAAQLRDGRRPFEAELSALTPTEWQVFLSLLGKRLRIEECAWLDETFQLSTKQNLEIRVGYLGVAAASGYEACFPAVRATLLATGRGKYLRPLYTGLIEGGPAGKTAAKAIAAEALPSYHPVGQGLVESILRGAS